MKKLLRGSLWIAMTTCLAVCSPARAGLLSVTCNVMPPPSVNFGTYDPSSGMSDDVTGGITVNCNGTLTLFGSNTVNASIKLSPGKAGNFSPRRMSGLGSGGLPYNLYTSGSHSVIWGDGTGGSSVLPMTIALTGILGLLASGSATATIYGRIPPGQAVTAGTYSDSILVTVTY
ncbi:MAG: SCPU domain-containing protein [Nevskiaceae bacterium]|nr:MAG: SCPU domain-containing protein [Nevskiaceae bacterium]TBR74799.1 MAG: SCPU domain-containing protein [Nevskiaceae bacterium]